MDILFLEAFTLIGIDIAQILLTSMQLKGFSRETVQLVGTITLSVVVSSAPCTALVMVDFLVVKSPSSYNATISRPTFNKLKAITSTYHLKVKFPIAQGIGEIQGKQNSARECYVQELKPKIEGMMRSVNMCLS